jgi:hypothetical protein
VAAAAAAARARHNAQAEKWRSVRILFTLSEMISTFVSLRTMLTCARRA